MKKLSGFFPLIFFLSITAFFSCKKNIDSNGWNPQDHPFNKVPVSSAGPDQVIFLPKDSVILDGNGSADPDGIISIYQWSKSSGPASFLIVNPELATTKVINLVEGVYQFELKVTDNRGLIAKDIVQVSVIQGQGPGDCSLNDIPQVNATLTGIGTLSISGSPYVAASGSKIVFAGGTHGSGAVDIYDINRQTWERAELSAARTNLAMVSCGNKIFIAGGNTNGQWYDNIDIYDVSDGSWTVTHLREPRSFLAAATVGNKVLFAGGITEEGWNQTSLVEIYDISDNTWTYANLSEAKICVNAVTKDNKVYFAGGFNYLSGFASALPGVKSVDIYNASTNTWSTSSFSFISGGVSGAVSGDNIYWAGIAWPKHDGKVETWNTQNGDVTVSCLAYARNLPTAVTKNNTIVFFPGGPANALSDDEPSDMFDIYNTLTGQKFIGILDHRVVNPAVISVNNIIYMAGGKTTSGFTDKVYTVSW